MSVGYINHDYNNSNRIGPGEMPGERKEVKQFYVKALPNPSGHYFNISISGNATGKILLRVVDVYGREIEQRSNLSYGQTIQLGEGYNTGVYFVEIKQGSQRRFAKIVKQ